LRVKFIQLCSWCWNPRPCVCI